MLLLHLHISWWSAGTLCVFQEMEDHGKLWSQCTREIEATSHLVLVLFDIAQKNPQLVLHPCLFNWLQVLCVCAWFKFSWLALILLTLRKHSLSDFDRMDDSKCGAGNGTEVSAKVKHAIHSNDVTDKLCCAPLSHFNGALNLPILRQTLPPCLLCPQMRPSMSAAPVDAISILLQSCFWWISSWTLKCERGWSRFVTKGALMSPNKWTRKST